MSRENIALARRVLEDAFNKGELSVIDDVCADGFVDHDPLMGDGSKEELKQRIATYRDAFPDLEITIDEIFAAGDRVVTRWNATGTFQNPIMGLEPTGDKGPPVQGIGIDRIENGKIVESWGQWDTLRFMRNIGAIPEEAATTAGS
jgi:steroid delta-isomerase-like uncharacterized protein